MDFKVAGTRDFITAIQLDTKLDGIPADVLASALTQAREARLFILDVMREAIDGPDEMSPYAPRIITVKVPVDKIGEVIGPKGKMINQIQEETGADLTIEDDGTVYIGAIDGASAEAARTMVNAIANPQMPEVGERYVGTVVKTTSFGAFISLTPGKDGLLHISQIRKLVGGRRVENVEDVLDVLDAPATDQLADLGDVQQTVLAGRQRDERAERRGLDDGADVPLAHLGHLRVGDRVDHRPGRLGRGTVDGADVHGAVVLDGDVRAGLLLDLVDHLALRADDLADLVDRHLDRDDPRCVRRHLVRPVDRLAHHVQDVQPGLAGLGQRTGEDVGGDPVELGVQPV